MIASAYTEAGHITLIVALMIQFLTKLLTTIGISLSQRVSANQATKHLWSTPFNKLNAPVVIIILDTFSATFWQILLNFT